jgi:hypothetical protein
MEVERDSEIDTEMTDTTTEAQGEQGQADPFIPTPELRYGERHTRLNHLCRILRGYQENNEPLSDWFYEQLFDILNDYDNLCHHKDTIDRATASDEMVRLCQEPVQTPEIEQRIAELRAYLDERWEKAYNSPHDLDARRIIRDAAELLRSR